VHLPGNELEYKRGAQPFLCLSPFAPVAAPLSPRRPPEPQPPRVGEENTGRRPDPGREEQHARRGQDSPAFSLVESSLLLGAGARGDAFAELAAMRCVTAEKGSGDEHIQAR